MSFWNQALHKPQPLFPRRAMFQIHLWAGLAIGLWAFGIGLTGSILVFHEQIDSAINHLVIPSFTTSGPKGSFDGMVKAVRERFPKGQINLKPAHHAGELAVANIYQQNQAHAVLLNPHSGAVLQVRNRRGTLLQMVERFHSNLFLARPGRLLNGILGVVTLVMAVTGIVIWWPGLTQWRRRLTVNFRAPWRIWMWELHHAAGFWCLFYIVLSAVTGAYFTWPQQYRAAISWFSPVSQRASLRLDPPAGGAWRPIDELVAAAESALPKLPIENIQVPSDRTQPVRIIKLAHEPASMRSLIFVAVNPYTAEVMNIEYPAANTTGDHLFGWIGPLHTGHFGGFPVAVLWALLGLSLPLLFVSGFLMWWNRVIAKRL